MAGGFLWSVKISLLYLFISLLLFGCAEPSVLSESENSNKEEAQSFGRDIDLDDNETLDRILAEATDLDSLRTFRSPEVCFTIIQTRTSRTRERCIRDGARSCTAMGRYAALVNSRTAK